MKRADFDGGLSLSMLIALECIVEDSPDEVREKFIKEYKEDNPEEWEQYLEFRREMNHPEL